VAGFWKNLWKFLQWAGKNAPAIIAAVDSIKKKTDDEKS
jgi:hypothetical protein